MSTQNPLSLDFMAHKPEKAAALLQRLPEQQAAAFLDEIPTRILTPVIEHMENWPAARILEQLPASQHAAVIHRLHFQTAAALVRLHPATRRNELFAELSQHQVKSLRRSLSFADNTVGACVDTSAAPFTATTRVSECLALLRKMTTPAGHLLAITDSMHRIVGVLSVDHLLASHDHAMLGDLADTRVTPLDAQMSLSVAEAAADWQRYTMLPVRAGNHFLGIVSRETLLLAKRRLHPELDQAPTDSLTAHLIRAMFASAGGLLALFSFQLPHSPAGEPQNERDR